MKSKAVWALVVLNVLLLASLCLHGLTPSARAQGRGASDYLMIPGEVVGGNASIIYIVDTRNAQLSARAYDQQARALVDMGQPIDLGRIFGNGGR
ncbi:MAG TPA: hypothetical protein VH370_04800 [Humisphaera sp.]|jgi:hypothetical protein|nr:hypothetical protein [Humisphaera sp.]